MSPNQELIFNAALTLPSEERASLAGKLLESLDTLDQAEVDAAWVKEVQRRVQALERGEARLIPAEEVLQAIRSRKKA